WLAFYVKLWAMYLLPALATYEFLRWNKGGRRAAVTFACASLVLHGTICLVWKAHVGEFLPFIWHHAAAYPIPRAELAQLFWTYPKMLVSGSEFGTTLFGIVPYVLVLGL